MRRQQRRREARSTCWFCAAVQLVEPALHFACTECGRQMLRLDAEGVADVYHCPDHCTTLLPSAEMIARAQAARN